MDQQYIEFKNTILDGIKVRQSVNAPEEEIIVHPSVMAKILNSTHLNHFVDVFIKKG